jgi:hypothetical protein
MARVPCSSTTGLRVPVLEFIPVTPRCGAYPAFNSRCKVCEHTCSRQTFSTTCCLRHQELLVQAALGLGASSAHRQIARSAKCAQTSVTRMAERLAVWMGAWSTETWFYLERSAAGGGCASIPIRGGSAPESRNPWTSELPTWERVHAAYVRLPRPA